MSKKMRFWTILGILALSITCGISYHTTSKAETSLISKGRLVYRNSDTSETEIVLDTRDHITLNNNIVANATEILELKEFVEDQNVLNEELLDADEHLQQEIEEISDGLSGVQFGIDADGKYGFYGEDGSFIPFRSSSDKARWVLVGTTTSFNISDVVGAENIGKYSPSDFILVPNISDWQTSGGWAVNDTSRTEINLSKQSSCSLTYDSSTGDVRVTNMVLNILNRHYDRDGSGNYTTTSGTYTVPTNTYLILY